MSSIDFSGSESGWDVSYDGRHVLHTGPGYVLVANQCCGICSTDLARRHLPYALPQVIGHEVICQKDRQLYAVEINASHKARRIGAACPMCAAGLHTHCPERITLGINGLPGGFAPFLLAPEGALVALPENLPLKVAALIEPFAAALHAVETASPENGEVVAVLGPRKLGLLIITALSLYRHMHKLDYKIVAFCRHENLRRIARSLGADECCTDAGANAVDLLFDTTGSPEGFSIALGLTRSRLHLKSTHGQTVQGLDWLTAFVVDELRLQSLEALLLPLKAGVRVWVSPAVTEGLLEQLVLNNPEASFERMSAREACKRPYFSGAISASLLEVSQIIRPASSVESSFLWPRSTIFLQPSLEALHPLQEKLQNGLRLESSRCGDFSKAFQLLAFNPATVEILHEQFITHEFELASIERAFQVAGNSKQSIKVLVDTKI